MQTLWLCLLATIIISFLSRRALLNPRCHGFYRYFAFIGIIALLYRNGAYWFSDMYSARQLISWVLLFTAAVIVVQALYLLRRHGGKRSAATPTENLGFENTEQLVQRGIFAYIRHPMYCSLACLATGITLKNPDLTAALLCLLTYIMLYGTARAEERENSDFFGSSYLHYMRSTKRFIPFLV